MVKRTKRKIKAKKAVVIKKPQPRPRKVNHLGYPHDDPYGLSEAFWKIFTKPNVTDKKRN